MNQIEINSVSGLATPFSAITCDVYGNNCSYIGSGSTTPITFSLPIQFNSAPAVELTLIDISGCTLSRIIDCTL